MTKAHWQECNAVPVKRFLRNALNHGAPARAGNCHRPRRRAVRAKSPGRYFAHAAVSKKSFLTFQAVEWRYRATFISISFSSHVLSRICHYRIVLCPLTYKGTTNESNTLSENHAVHLLKGFSKNALDPSNALVLSVSERRDVLSPLLRRYWSAARRFEKNLLNHK